MSLSYVSIKIKSLVCLFMKSQRIVVLTKLGQILNNTGVATKQSQVGETKRSGHFAHRHLLINLQQDGVQKQNQTLVIFVERNGRRH
jgi:hypothetical protein